MIREYLWRGYLFLLALLILGIMTALLVGYINGFSALGSAIFGLMGASNGG